MAKAKTRTIYVCNSCGVTSLKWQGRCPDCGEWNTYVETVDAPRPIGTVSRTAPSGAGIVAQPQQLATVSADSLARHPVPISELSRVLGGGIVPGSLVLIGGDPGVGKSTLLLQLCEAVCAGLGSVLYISGEESVHQIRLRASRLGAIPDNLYVLSETNIQTISDYVESSRPGIVIVDSIQTMYAEGVESAAGSVSQVRECTMALMRLAKGSGVPVFLVGHVTKEGAIAGPRVLEHIVDTVLYLEGDRFHQYRLLRAAKNRYGSTNEVGVFEMTQEGMVEVPNPSEAFLSERPEDTIGSSVGVMMEGTRPLLVEVQALTSYSGTGISRRTANGLDYNRLLLLAAVLGKRVGVSLGDQDIYVNVVGGLKLEEPAADLAVAVAIASSAAGRAVKPETVLIGEVGLSGELRSVPQLERRLSEAAKLGYTRAVCSRTSRKPQTPDGLKLLQAGTLADAIGYSLEAPQGTRRSVE
ncbi:MAG: DNA repair protein RadA [Chloroflexota bacterium]|nr:DNA repair protein RadA [Chloroflexota bacterium]